jgi:hypothetical protein
MVMIGKTSPSNTQADAVAAYKLHVTLSSRQTILCVSQSFYAQLKKKHKKLEPSAAKAQMKAEVAARARAYMKLIDGNYTDLEVRAPRR